MNTSPSLAEPRDAVPAAARKTSATTAQRDRSTPKSRKKNGAASWLFLQAERLALLAIIVLIWHLAAVNGLIADVLSRTPGQVWDYLVQATQSGELWEATRATLSATALAFVLSAVVGVSAGIGIGLLPHLERVVSPFLDAVNAMPRIALAPLFIIYFGIGTEAKVALGFSIAVFIIMSAARAGVKTADHEVLRMSRVMNASKPQIFWKVLLPVSVPSIFSGLRLGFIYSLLGVVTSEIIGAKVGLGQLVIYYSGIFEMEAIYGILIVLAVIASVINLAMSMLESRILRWQPPTDR